MTSHLPHIELGLFGSRYESLSGFLSRDFALKGMQTGKAGFLQILAAITGPDVQKHVGGVLGRSDTTEILAAPKHIKLNFTLPRLMLGHGAALHNATDASQPNQSRLVPRVRKESWRTGN